jgi:4,5-DOPA dioxygenase extradiol
MEKMPVLFVGHGSPMNAIENNEFTRSWEQLGTELPRPTAILSVSAHWYVSGTKISNTLKPKQVYDMYGFPDELYRLEYPVAGSLELAKAAFDLTRHYAEFDNTWGIDHGTWAVLVKMYPKADVPVVQLSIDRNAPPEFHYSLGQALKPLREQGVLILGSGNIVHNLGLIDWGMEGGFEWAQEFDAFIKDRIVQKDFASVVNYTAAGRSARLAVPTPDHYFPLLYALGAADESDKVRIFNDKCLMGSMSMTGYVFGG